MKQLSPQMQVSYRRPDPLRERLIIRNCQEAYEALLTIWNEDTICLYEEFVVIYLDRNSAVLGYKWIARGSVSACVVNVKLIMTLGLLCNCSKIILAHNHPSGNPEPSPQDLIITKRIQKAGKLFDIMVLDHLILTHTGFTSLNDEGHLPSM